MKKLLHLRLFSALMLMLCGVSGTWVDETTLVSSSTSKYYEQGYITGVAGTNCATWTAPGFVMTQNKVWQRYCC